MTPKSHRVSNSDDRGHHGDEREGAGGEGRSGVERLAPTEEGLPGKRDVPSEAGGLSGKCQVVCVRSTGWPGRSLSRWNEKAS